MSTWNRYNNFNSSMPETVKDETIGSRLSVLLANPNITDGDKAFATSLLSGFQKFKSLTVRQNEAFKKMEGRYANGNTPAANPTYDEWRNSFDDAKRKILNICAEYYMGTDYFRDLAFKAKNDPNFIPTEKQYRAMCENKYAQKLIANINSEPRYKENTIVVFRETARVYTDQKIGVIIKTYPCNSPTAGSREYDLLPFGKDVPMKVRESQIKVARDKDFNGGD